MLRFHYKYFIECIKQISLADTFLNHYIIFTYKYIIKIIRFNFENFNL